MLKLNADNAEGFIGFTPRKTAACHGHTEAVRVLLQYSARKQVLCMAVGPVPGAAQERTELLWRAVVNPPSPSVGPFGAFKLSSAPRPAFDLESASMSWCFDASPKPDGSFY